jgi:hypothetical protein
MAETPQQDLSRREFEALFPGFSAAMRSLRANGFQQVTIHEGQEFPQIRGFVQTGPSVLSSYNNEIGPAIPAIDSINGDGIGGGGYADPGEGGDGGSGGNPGQENRYSCVNGQCVEDPDGVYIDLVECRETGCTGAPTVDDPGTGIPTSSGCPCPTTPFMAELISVGSVTVVAGRDCYEYGFQEVVRNTTGFGYVAATGGKTSATYGLAHNMYEQTVDNNGGNTPPTGVTVTRKAYPLSIVFMALDVNNKPWFSAANPTTVTCPP